MIYQYMLTALLVLRRDKENLEKKNNELSNALQDKNLQFGKLQGLYEHLKRKMLAGGMSMIISRSL